MWIEGKYMTETEVTAYIASLKAELIDTLRKASMCRKQYENPDICCSECDYFYFGSKDGCPSAYNSYAAKLRLEELTGGKTIC